MSHIWGDASNQRFDQRRSLVPSILPAESAYAAAEASAADTGGLAPMMSSQNMKTISPTTAGRVYR